MSVHVLTTTQSHWYRYKTSKVGCNRGSNVAQKVALSAVPPRHVAQSLTAYVISDLVSCRHAADIISAVEFDWDGQHLATGDRGGRVVLFDRIPSQPVSAITVHLT